MKHIKEVSAMEMDLSISRFAKWGSSVQHGKRSKVLLREPEKCVECNKVFLSLYPLRRCSDHEGLDSM